MTVQDEKYMKMCFALAKRGRGKVSPNPLVGCVVLDKNGNVVSKGYHKKYGENHAERDALLKLKNNEAEGGTLYVNLEPCSHWGQTPPCVDLIIEKKLARVVYAIKDCNPVVNGSEKLKKAGIEVIEGILEKEAKFLNRVFIKNMTQKLPYVVLKTATTMDGKIASKTGDSKWITSEKARKEVYKMRKSFDCVLTSSNTVLADNPKMEHKFKCILDKDLRITKDAQIFKQGEIYVASKNNTSIKNSELDLREVLTTLYKKGICSVFIECGGTLAGAFLREGLVDEVYQFIAPKILNDNDGMSCFNGGGKCNVIARSKTTKQSHTEEDKCNKISDCVNLEIYEVKKFAPDILIKAIVKKP